MGYRQSLACNAYYYVLGRTHVFAGDGFRTANRFHESMNPSCCILHTNGCFFMAPSFRAKAFSRGEGGAAPEQYGYLYGDAL